jgi:hypothetical protein
MKRIEREAEKYATDIYDKYLGSCVSLAWAEKRDDFLAGARWMREEAAQYLIRYREAYPEDLFTPIQPGEPDPISRDRIAGEMGRFVLDNCQRDILKLGEEDTDG